MSEDENKDIEELKRELNFYRNQTKVLRERNRDLRNALLVAESKQAVPSQEETAQESLSDIRKIIADSKKTISKKLTEFRETIADSNGQSSASVEPPMVQETSSASPTAGTVPSTPKVKATLGSTKSEEKTPEAQEATSSVEMDVLKNQMDYLKKEVDRLETFLEQSEMVNNRLQQLLSEHNIDVSKISQAIDEASKTAVSPKAVKSKSASKEPITSSKQTAPKTKVEEPQKTKPKTRVEDLDSTIIEPFNELKIKLKRNLTSEQISLEILDLREKLMELIPHSRVFYEMQVEYRRWKRGASSEQKLEQAMEKWKQTIAETYL